jgi:hypothetical protein
VKLSAPKFTMDGVGYCCTYHCGHCHRHFRSLGAFDAHRQGDYASSDPELGRHCVSPLELDGKLTAITESGTCRMYEGRTERGVTVWSVAGDLARIRRHFPESAYHEAERKPLAA